SLACGGRSADRPKMQTIVSSVRVSGDATMIFTGRLAMLSVVVGAIGVAQPSACSANPAAYEIGADPNLGFNLISWYNDPNGLTAWHDAVTQIHDAGFREVSISPVRYFNTTTG